MPGQNDDNELQKAIDDITKSALKPTETPVAEIENKVQEEVAPAKVELNPVPAQEEVELVGALEEMPVAQNITEIPQDLEGVKKEMLRELFPLIDKINLKPEQKFRVYREMIETTGDKSMVMKAHEVARALEDEQKRGEALVFLLEAIDK